MDTLKLIQAAASLVMAGVFLWAGLEKTRDLASFAATIRRIGVPRVLAAPAALLIAVTEIGLAVALLFIPESPFTQFGIVLLAGLFAIAGVIVLSTGKRIRCHCLGAGAKGHLGRPQLIALIPWLAGTALLRLGAQEALPVSMGAAYFAATSLGIASMRGVAVRKARLEARGDRLSAREMYRWLQSR